MFDTLCSDYCENFKQNEKYSDYSRKMNTIRIHTLKINFIVWIKKKIIV